MLSGVGLVGSGAVHRATALEPNFGPGPTAGVVRLPRESVLNVSDSVAVAPNGDVAFATFRSLVRLTAGGSIDSGFDASGLSSCVESLDIDYSADNVLFAASNGSTGCTPLITIARRFLPTGAEDPTFDGTVDLQVGDVRLVAVDGGVVVSGRVGGQACVFRFRAADGVLDPTFGPASTPGRACFDVPNGAFRVRAATQPSGGFTVVANSNLVGDSMVTQLAHVSASGVVAPDVVSLDLGSAFAHVSDLIVESNGEVVLLGIDFTAQHLGAFVVRLGSSGAPVAGFPAIAGEVAGRLQVGDSPGEWAMTPTDDGRYALAGARGDEARIIVIDGQGRSDLAFEPNGPTPGSAQIAPQAPASISVFRAVAFGNGRVVAAGPELTDEPFGIATASLVAMSEVLGPTRVADTALYRPVAPERILDTRPGLDQTGYAGPKPGSLGTFDLQIAGRAGIPNEGVGAVALNLTATQSSGPGFVTVWPAGRQRPNVSSLNLERTGQTLPTLVVVPVGDGGRISLFTLTGTHLLADVVGWFPAGGALRTVQPARLLDTRPEYGPIGYTGSKPAASGVVTLQVAGRGGLPSSGVAVALANVTITEAANPGFVTVWSGASTLPMTSSLNAPRVGQTTSNFVFVPVAADGTIKLFTSGGGHLLVDVVGWLPSGSGYQPVADSPSPRIVDSARRARRSDRAGCRRRSGARLCIVHHARQRHGGRCRWGRVRDGLALGY